MTQDECLASPHHSTFDGACYPGSVAYIGLSSADHPLQATFSITSVPEPRQVRCSLLRLSQAVCACALCRAGERSLAKEPNRPLVLSTRAIPSWQRVGAPEHHFRGYL